MSVWETKFVAAYGLSIIKSYVEGCGGDSHIYLLENNGIGYPVSMKNTKELEETFSFFEEAMRPVLLSFASFGNEFPSGTFEQRLKIFLNKVRTARRSGANKYEKEQRKAVERTRMP